MLSSFLTVNKPPSHCLIIPSKFKSFSNTTTPHKSSPPHHHSKEGPPSLPLYFSDISGLLLSSKKKHLSEVTRKVQVAQPYKYRFSLVLLTLSATPNYLGYLFLLGVSLLPQGVKLGHAGKNLPQLYPSQLLMDYYPELNICCVPSLYATWVDFSLKIYLKKNNISDTCQVFKRWLCY